MRLSPVAWAAFIAAFLFCLPANAAGDGVGAPPALRRATLQKPLSAYAENLKMVERLMAAARQGDTLALVKLEKMRRKGETGAPSLSDIVEIETVRAESGEAMTAWRLAQRYESGDGVAPSSEEMIRWLKVAGGEAAGDYPKARDAAFRLCEIYGRGAEATADLDEARAWCERAAGAGHKGAAIVIARLRAADE